MARRVDKVLGRFAVAEDDMKRWASSGVGSPATYALRDMRRGKRERYRVYRDDEWFGSDDPDYVFDQFVWDVHNQALVRSGDFLLIHAGAVSTPKGLGVILPGPSGSGKTTVVAGLVRAGFDYLSDEAAAIDPVSGRLHPFPKVLSLKDESRKLFPQSLSDDGGNPQYVDPDTIRPHALGKTCDVRFVVALHYVPGVRAELAPLTPAQGCLELGQNLINLGRYQSRAWPLLARLAKQARSYRLRFGGLEEAVQELKRLDR
jgi:hypothetical protein